jgi:hypothetical protein
VPNDWQEYWHEYWHEFHFSGSIKFCGYYPQILWLASTSVLICGRKIRLLLWLLIAPTYDAPHQRGKLGPVRMFLGNRRAFFWLPFDVYAPLLAQIIKCFFGSSKVETISPAKKHLRSATKRTFCVTSSYDIIICAKQDEERQKQTTLLRQDSKPPLYTLRSVVCFPLSHL